MFNFVARRTVTETWKEKHLELVLRTFAHLEIERALCVAEQLAKNGNIYGKLRVVSVPPLGRPVTSRRKRRKSLYECGTFGKPHKMYVCSRVHGWGHTAKTFSRRQSRPAGGWEIIVEFKVTDVRRRDGPCDDFT